jgi:dienelactone hydrolase
MHILVCHSVLGLREVELECATMLREAGHVVSVPDLFGGARATSIADGAAIVAALGWPAVVEPARSALEHLPNTAVLAGFSMGVGVASQLLAERSEAAGAIFFHALPSLPADIRPGFQFQVHAGGLDREFVSEPAISKLKQDARARRSHAQVFTYPGAEHFFTDRLSEEHNAAAAQICWQRALDFLGTIATQEDSGLGN